MINPEGAKTEQLSAREAVVKSWAIFLRWWHTAVIQTVDQESVIERRREDSDLTGRYLFLIAMSGGIAILGLLQSSAAVVIGAMLLSPLMGPIIGLGFALATGDYHWLRQAGKSLAYGGALAVLLCAVIVFFSPLKEITPEIAARTRPNLFDLLIALFSALAGAYAMIRGREGTIVGVAIATALMPPLATVGFGLATFNWTVFSGALLLFVTNLLTIALTAWGMGRLYGFRTKLSEKQTRYQNFAVILVFVILAIPLGFSLRTIAWETNAQRIIRSELGLIYGADARISDFNVDWTNDPVSVTATMLTPKLVDNAQGLAQRRINERVGKDIALTLTQFEVGTRESAAERAQLAAVRASEVAAEARADELGARLALIAGVEPADVLIDRQKRRALVRAAELPGAGLRAYAVLESRLARTESGWTINLIPPIATLPEFAATDSDYTEDQLRALGLAAWAAQRRDMVLQVTGSGENAERVTQILRKLGAKVESNLRPGPVTIGWAQKSQGA